MIFTGDRFDLDGRPDEEIAEFLAHRAIGLSVEEAKHLQFAILRRPPSLAEFVLFGIEGSEHCSYKSSRVHLKQFITSGENVVLGASEDAGVVRVGRDRAGVGYCVVISHESHNHPSQIVPYEGAATGVGGNVRDICCMGAEVVALADDLRFGRIDSPKSKWIYDGVVSGVAGYGNPIGVPSLAGGLQFDPGYQENCLVTVVSLGIVREDRILHSYAPVDAEGYDLILVGKATDGSGFGGASFASFELVEEDRETNKGAVQEPNAFLGRHLLQASTALFRKLSERGALHRVGCKDLGAGGIACAGVEIADAAGYGAEIDIDMVHTDTEGLAPHVILCSETQERYMWASPPELTPLILDHFNREYSLPEVSRGAEARVVGRITASRQFLVRARSEVIVDAPAAQVTQGFLYHRPWTEPQEDFGKENGAVPSSDAGAMLLQLLAHENIASRHVLFERYDKQVQGRTIVEAGSADCGIIAPFNNGEYPEEVQRIGVTLTTDQNPRVNRRDPYRGAVMAVVESYSNTIAGGAEPLAISDCLCYGNPENPQQMGQFVAGCRGVADACRELELPVVAGNVSFYNESASGSIPPSPMIACIGRLTDYHSFLPGHFVAPGSRIYLVGDRVGRWGGSVYEELSGDGPGPLPVVDETLYTVLRSVKELVRRAGERTLLRACHDISEGGLGVALCEMSFPASLGFAITIPLEIAPVRFLFEETPGFVMEVAADREGQFLELAREHGVQAHVLGETRAQTQITVEGETAMPLPEKLILDLPLERLRTCWERGLMEKLL